MKDLWVPQNFHNMENNGSHLLLEIHNKNISKSCTYTLLSRPFTTMMLSVYVLKFEDSPLWHQVSVDKHLRVMKSGVKQTCSLETSVEKESNIDLILLEYVYERTTFNMIPNMPKIVYKGTCFTNILTPLYTSHIQQQIYFWYLLRLFCFCKSVKNFWNPSIGSMLKVQSHQ